jgi:hypothetical protein
MLADATTAGVQGGPPPGPVFEMYPASQTHSCGLEAPGGAVECAGQHWPATLHVA